MTEDLKFVENIKRAERLKHPIPDNWYDIPKIDNALQERGWTKFRDNPVYYKELTDWGQPGRYKVWFPNDFKAHFLIYLNPEVTEEMFNKAMDDIPSSMSGMLTSPANLESGLLMWTSDFYWWQGDWDKSEKYAKEFEVLTGKICTR